MKDKRPCTVDGCEKLEHCKQLCQMHYWRVRKFGSADLPVDRAPHTRGWSLADRVAFYTRVAANGCIEWVGSLNGGYGALNVDGHSRRAHRVAYEVFVEPIPEGLEIDHICRNRACVNPDHLEPVTASENVRRAYAVKMHCPHSAHVCRSCRNEKARTAYHARKLAEATS